MEIEKTSNEAIGKRIQTLREEKGITQMQFAVALGTSNRENIARWEAGTREIKVGMLAKISEILNVSADYILGLSDVKSTEQDMKIACEVTGLSEKAIENIKSYELDENSGEDFLDVFKFIPKTILENETPLKIGLNAFIEAPAFLYFCDSLTKAVIYQIADIYELEMCAERNLKYNIALNFNKISKAYAMDTYEAVKTFLHKSEAKLKIEFCKNKAEGKK